MPRLTRKWDQASVLFGLMQAARIIKGKLPCSDRAWNDIRKERQRRLEWPPANEVLRHYRSMARAWLAAGVSTRRISLKNIDWTEDELAYVLDNAGKYTLRQIARKLGRTAGAVRRKLYDKNLRARDNLGYLSAAQLAKDYQCPYHRVRDLLARGEIKAQYDPVRHEWNIPSEAVTDTVKEKLRAPKRTHKTWETDTGNYRPRYGIRRKATK